MSVSKAEFARLSNVSKATVSGWIKNGQIFGAAIVGEGWKSTIDVAVAQHQLAIRRDAGQQLGNGRKTRIKPAPSRVGEHASVDVSDGDDPDAIEYSVERARYVRAQADGQELKNRLALGELLAARDVEHRWTSIMVGIRSAMLRVPSRVRDEVPHLTPTDIAKIDIEIRRALSEASDVSTS